MKKLNFENYNILIADKLTEVDFNNTKIKACADNHKVLLITDENVYNIYKDVIDKIISRYNNSIFLVKPGDNYKNEKTFLKLLEFAIEKTISRDDLIIGFGGGAVLDLVGFFAATYKRGINYIAIPTTIIAQIDACAGSKVGINYNNIKNQVGTFYDPKEVIIITEFTKTLPSDEVLSGIGEIIKTAFVGDSNLVKKLLNENFIYNSEIIYDTLKVKQTFVLLDYYDRHERNVLNFGHTFGHVIESLSNFTIPHGIAVLSGIKHALTIGEQLNLTNITVKDKLNELINKFNINIPQTRLCEGTKFLANDKKVTSSGVNLVILEDIAKPLIVNVNWNMLYDIANSTCQP